MRDYHRLLIGHFITILLPLPNVSIKPVTCDMDKDLCKGALCPERFTVLPNSPGAGMAFSHWFQTFTNYAKRLTENDQDKLEILVNKLSPEIYALISECKTFEKAESTLKDAYVKPPNAVFARHLLSTRKQNDGEKLDEYLQALKLLGKDCNFQSVTAEVYKSEYIRDTFISGIKSLHIRQRLLENNSSDVQTVFEQARALESAQESMLAYQQTGYQDDYAINAIFQRWILRRNEEYRTLKEAKPDIQIIITSMLCIQRLLIRKVKRKNMAPKVRCDRVGTAAAQHMLVPNVLHVK